MVQFFCYTWFFMLRGLTETCIAYRLENVRLAWMLPDSLLLHHHGQSIPCDLAAPCTHR